MPKPRAQIDPRLLRARDRAVELMARHGLHGWLFAFNRNVRRAGVCRFPHPHPPRPGRVELSAHFVVRNPEAEVEDTILHEIAHALVGPGHAHDAVWKAKCREVGARPRRCYGEETDMPSGRWRATCPGCRKEHTRHRRPKKPTGWHCRACGKEKGPIRWELALKER